MAAIKLDMARALIFLALKTLVGNPPMNHEHPTNVPLQHEERRKNKCSLIQSMQSTHCMHLYATRIIAKNLVRGRYYRF